MHSEPYGCRRWAIVIASMCALTVGNAPLLVFTFGIFSKALAAEFELSRAVAFSALSVLTWAGALAIPLFGMCLDRFGVRRPTLISIALVCIALACASQTRSFVAFLMAFALIGACSGGLTPLPYAKVLAAWFDRRRGLALGLAMSGTGIGGALVPLLAQYLLAHHGWRIGYLGIAAVAAVIGLLSVAIFIREPNPTEMQEQVPASAMRGDELETWGSILTRREFWLIALSVFAVCTALTGTLVTLSPLMTDLGASAATAAVAVSVAGLASAVGRLLTGVLMDIWPGPRVAAGAFLASSSGIALLAVGGDTWVYVTAGVLIGGGLGAEVDVIGYLISRYFGMATFGRVYGLVFFAFGVATGIGGYLLGLCHDLSGSYRIGVWVFAGLCLVGALMISRLGPYRFAPHMTGEPTKAFPGLPRKSVS